MIKFGRNGSDFFFFEKLTFMRGHFTSILTKIGLMLRNSPKIELYSKAHEKNSIDVKWQALQSGYLEKRFYWENLFKIQILGNLKNKNSLNIIEPHVSYLHAKYLGNSSIFGTPRPNRPKTFKNYANKTFFKYIFFEVLDNWQRWKWYRCTRTGKLNRMDPNFSPNNQL